MRVCITINAEAKTNALIARITNALEHGNYNIRLVTRNRFINEKGNVKLLKYKTMQNEVSNYEIRLYSELGRGLLNLFQLVYYQFLLFKWLLRHKKEYDIIHAVDLDTGFPTLILSKLVKKKYVYHIADFYVDSRGGIPKLLKNIIKKLEFLVINNAETTVICTEERRSQIKGSKPKNLVVMHNTPIPVEMKNNNTFVINNSNLKSNITIAYVGALGEKRFIKNAINVIKKYPEISLNIAGLGKMEKIVEEASKNYININYYGQVDYETALKIYSISDVMFAIYDPNVPNHKYSAPNKVYEAMFLGKPIIVAKDTGIDQIVKNNEMGIVINYTEEAFEKALSVILSNPEKIKQTGENAKKAYNIYSWEKMRDLLVKVYKDINPSF